MAYPKSVTVLCDPSPAAEKVTAYHFATDGGTPVVSSKPEAIVSIPTPGPHTFVVRAENAEGFSAPATLIENFLDKPGVPLNIRINL